MTRTKKIAVVVLAFGLLLVFVSYGVHDVENDKRAKLRDELASANELNRSLVIADIKLELTDIEGEERFGGMVGGLGLVAGVIGGVMLIIGGKA